MARDFNININKSLLNGASVEKHPKLEDDKLNEVIRIADDILEIFDKRNTNLEDAYWILCSLADSIYAFATDGGIE